MTRASDSWLSCFDVVPEETSEWKPLMVPHAMVMNSSGNSGLAGDAHESVVAGDVHGERLVGVMAAISSQPPSVPTMTANSAPPTPAYSRNDDR